MKKKVLIVYYEMMLGGSTTSLISLLHNFDFSKYDVSLLLYHNSGPFLKYIPSEVKLLPQAMKERNKIGKIAKTLFNGQLVKSYYQGIKCYKKLKRAPQQSAYMQASLCRKIDKSYDVAIGFMELWSNVFVNKKITAKRKISWVHVDYEKAHYIPKLDKYTYNESDYIVNVSENCLENFNHSFPHLREKTIFIENILSKKFVMNRLNDAPSCNIPIFSEFMNVLSVCRIAIDHKGLDRGLDVISELVSQGAKIRWYIVGDGQDRELLSNLIDQKGANNYVFLLGSMDCPFGIYEKFDAFLLPSRYEGKPMAITESQMLELPPIVTEYASAREQIIDGITGFIANNDKESLKNLLYKLYTERDLLKKVKKELSYRNFDNVDCIQKIYNLIGDY